MKKIITLVLLFASSILLTYWITPTSQKLLVNDINLESAIPNKFGEWQVVDKNKLEVINPKDDSLVDKLYTQVLERTYVNSQGEAVMLSIAYGAEQRRDMLAHFPEVCYPAQGFNIDETELKFISILDAEFEVKFIKTQKGSRKEDITYWVRVGDKVVATRSEQKWHAVLYGVQGIIPDGLIFRVSTIGISQSSKVHEEFLNLLFASLNPETKIFLLSNIVSS